MELGLCLNDQFQRENNLRCSAHRNDGRHFIVHADEKLSAVVELEREVLTVTFYLESIQ
jgi:hypothetical protein